MYKDEAIKKLEDESKEKTSNRKADAIKRAVVKQLKNFCTQDDEFAQAIVQSSDTVNQCLEKVTEKCGNCLSDIDAYSKAVAFYFPGAKVHMKLEIDLIGDVRENCKSNVIKLDFADLF